MQNPVYDAARRRVRERTRILWQCCNVTFLPLGAYSFLHTLKVSIFSFLPNERYVAASLGLRGFPPLQILRFAAQRR